MHSRLRIISSFANTPWALEPGVLDAFASLLLDGRDDISAAADPRATFAARASVSSNSAGEAIRQNVAVIPIYGVITQRASMVSDICPGAGTSTQAIEKAIRSAAADPSARSIVLDIDSPGGSVFGVQELADIIMEMRAQKPIAAIANAQASSAAYWIGSAAHEFFVTPSGVAGSIGVYMVHVDTTRADEAAGKTKTVIKAGRYKAEGEGPLTEEAIAHLQSMTDLYYSTFVRQVSRHRNVPVERVRNGYGQGRSVPAQAALEAGMVDGVATLSEVISKYARRTAETANRGRTVSGSALDVTSRVSHSVEYARLQLRMAEAGVHSPVAKRSLSVADAERRIKVAEANLPPQPLAKPATQLDDYRERVAAAGKPPKS